MILYKYYSPDSGLEALKSQKLGFRCPVNFNDPFELSLLDDAIVTEHDRNIESLKTHVAILSLSRSFSNPLMWAHYASAHEGIVIGYDVDNEFLNSKDLNIIPAMYGDVIYRNSKLEPINLENRASFLEFLIECSIGNPLTYSARDQKIIKDYFLTKHIAWAYEEEVRVVKPLYPMLSPHADRYTHYSPSGTHEGLYIFDQVSEIKEVYLGARFKKSLPQFLLACPNVPIFKMSIESHSWRLTPNKI